MKDSSSGTAETKGGVDAHDPRRIAPLAPGTKVGRYIVLETVGAGAMGTVCAAYDPTLDRKVALKFLHRLSGTGANPSRLLREAQAMARLPHPNVVPVHDVCFDGERPYVAMEFIDGQTVSEWLRQSRRTVDEILRVFVDAGRGLAAAHAADLVHRDVKPSNLLIDRTGRVLVTDFGLVRADRFGPDDEPVLETAETIAPTQSVPPTEPTAPTAATTPAPRVLTDEDATAITERRPLVEAAAVADSHGSGPSSGALSTPLTEIGTVVGTPAVMAPEQARGLRADARSDQFSFCASLYWALYRVLPFGDDRHADDPLPPPIEPPGSKVPRWLRRILIRGLSEDASARYPSMDALLAALSHDPRRTQRRVAGLAALALAIVAAVLFVRYQRRAESLVCSGAAGELRGVWDAERRAAVEQGFGRVGKSYGGAAFAATAAALDRYARDWAAMHISACSATRLRGEQSEELLDLRMQCLSHRKDELGQLVELFAHADGNLVDGAVQATASLTPLAGCADAAALKAPVPLPADPVLRARIQAVQHQLAKVHALIDAGQWSEGARLTEPLVAEARAIGHKPVLAEALFLLGYAQSRKFDDGPAEASFTAAVLAAEAGRSDAIAAHAYIELTQTIGDAGQERAAAALAAAEHARAFLERMGGDDPLMGKLQAILGTLYIYLGRFDEARRAEELGLTLRERHFGPTTMQVEQSVRGLGEVALVEARLDDAERLYRRALSIQEQIAPYHPETVLVLDSVAAVEAAQGHYGEAFATERRALTMTTQTVGTEHYYYAMTLAHLGEYELRLGHVQDAERLCRQALARNEKIWGPDHQEVASVLAVLGDIESDRGRFAKALALQSRAYAILDKALGPKHPDRAVGLVGLGVAYLGLGRTKEAVDSLERALSFRIGDRRRRADARYALSRALWRAGGSPERARTLATEARADYAAIGAPVATEVAALDGFVASKLATPRATPR